MARRVGGLIALILMTAGSWGAQATFGGIPGILKYVGNNNTRAILHFAGRVQFPGGKTLPTEEEARKAIATQIGYLEGPMFSQPERIGLPAKYLISDVAIFWTTVPGRFEAKYTFDGMVVVENKDSLEHEIILPIAPDLIYKASLVQRPNDADGKPQAPLEPCMANTSRLGAVQFPHFWYPNLLGCPLAEGVDYDVVVGALQRIPNTDRVTFPEYHRLFQNGASTAALFMGYYEDDVADDSVARWKDAGGEEYLKMQSWLKVLGFTRKRETNTKLYYAENYVKSTPRGEINVFLFLGVTTLSDERAKPFIDFYAQALKKTSIIALGGHSGSSRLPVIEQKLGAKVEFKKGYQILGLYGCAMYGQEFQEYLERKGTKDLDVLHTGITSYFLDQGLQSYGLIYALDYWSTKNAGYSWQDIVEWIDAPNASTPSGLLAVSGDEDNEELSFPPVETTQATHVPSN